MDKQIFDARGAYVDRVERLPYGELVTLRPARSPATAVTAATANRHSKRRRQFLPAAIALAMVIACLIAGIAIVPATQARSTPEAADTRHAPPAPAQYYQDELVYFVADTVPEPVPLQTETLDALPAEAPEAAAPQPSIPADANMLTDCTVTYYCTESYAHICGTGDDVTASGRPVEAGLSVAVDLSVIPLGSTVVVDYGDGELHYYRADDTGGMVNGHHIDIAVAAHDEALALGVKTATVWWWEN